MAAGQTVRFALHFWLGDELAPLPYPWLPALVSIAGAVLIVVLAPSADDLAWRFAYAIPATAGLIALIFASGLVRLPPDFMASLRRRLG